MLLLLALIIIASAQSPSPVGPGSLDYLYPAIIIPVACLLVILMPKIYDCWENRIAREDVALTTQPRNETGLNAV